MGRSSILRQRACRTSVPQAGLSRIGSSRSQAHAGVRDAIWPTKAGRSSEGRFRKTSQAHSHPLAKSSGAIAMLSSESAASSSNGEWEGADGGGARVNSPGNKRRVKRGFASSSSLGEESKRVGTTSFFGSSRVDPEEARSPVGGVWRWQDERETISKRFNKANFRVILLKKSPKFSRL